MAKKRGAPAPANPPQTKRVRDARSARANHHESVERKNEVDFGVDDHAEHGGAVDNAAQAGESAHLEADVAHGEDEGSTDPDDCLQTTHVPEDIDKVLEDAHANISASGPEVEKLAERLARALDSKTPLTSLSEAERAFIQACGERRVAKSTLARYLRVHKLIQNFCKEQGLPLDWIDAEESAAAACKFLRDFIFSRLVRTDGTVIFDFSFFCTFFK